MRVIKSNVLVDCARCETMASNLSFIVKGLVYYFVAMADSQNRSSYSNFNFRSLYILNFYAIKSIGVIMNNEPPACI